MDSVDFKKINNFIFDWDGTLIDSYPAHEKAFKYVLNYYGEDSKFFNYQDYESLSTYDVFKNLGVNNPIKFTNKKRAMYKFFCEKGEIKLMLDAFKLVRLLFKQQKKLFIVSNGSDTNVKVSLTKTKLIQYFDGIVTSSDVKFSKPDKEPYIHLINKFNLDTHKSIVIEDTINGLISATAAGLRTISIGKKNLSEYSNYHYPNLKKIINLL